MRKCKGCGVEFTPKTKRQKYCTPECWYARGLPAARKSLPDSIACAGCGVEFKPTKSRDRYCSRACWYEHGRPLQRGARHRGTAEERFFAKVNKTGSCWLWTGATGTGGYGNFYLEGRYVHAHRASLLLHGVEIAEGAVVMHQCDTPACVRPEHLSVGTTVDNLRDAARKGRMRGGVVLTESQVRKLRSDYAAGDVTQNQLADDYGVSQSTVHQVIRRKTWRHVD